MIHPVRRVGFAGLALALTLTGCSSSTSDNGAAPQSGQGTSSSESCPAPHAPGIPRSLPAKTAVSRAYRVFFNTNTSLADSVAVLQHGPKFCVALDKETNSPSANKITAKVSKVSLRGANVAQVRFTILSAGQTLLPNTHGLAVRERGQWKVAAQTFCSLLALEGTAPALCKDKSITALHG